MATLSLLLGLLVILNVVLLFLLGLMLKRQFGNQAQVEALKGVMGRSEAAQEALSRQFTSISSELAARLEQAKGDIRQQVADRLASGARA